MWKDQKEEEMWNRWSKKRWTGIYSTLKSFKTDSGKEIRKKRSIKVDSGLVVPKLVIDIHTKKTNEVEKSLEV